MEEDVGVKVTVTRLRRRLSVEQSEDGSVGGSPGPATPTKKRGGRLAAKPQLELIEENTQVSSPRKTRRKSLATDAEEKTITPSRRSSRIKSNSSIVSDTLLVQATDSPRARRAARRNSQAGSDNEGPATPTRQTRRTRKDSASSVENQESGTLNKPLPVAEMVIEEEPENEIPKTVNKSKSSPTAATEELSPNSARKSRRLLEKRNRRSGSQKTDQDSSSCSIENKSLNIPSVNEKVSEEKESCSRKSLNKPVKSKESNEYLSESNMSLLNKLETESKCNKLNHNKSASALDITGNDKSKRNRTESWPAITPSIANESINFSDNEIAKKRKGKSNRNFNAINDSKNNISNTSRNEKNISQSLLDTSSKRKKRESNIENSTKPCEDIQIEVLTAKDNISDKRIANDKSDNNDITRDMAVLFDNNPTNVQVSVYYEDSDSNGGANKTENVESEDQCVPEIKVIPNAEKNVLSNQISDDNDKISSIDVNISQLVSNDVNNSCEPMDIDETIHEEEESLKQTNAERQSLSSSQHSLKGESDNSKRKSSTSGSAAGTLDQSKKDKKKLSISNTTVDTLDMSKNDKGQSSISNAVEYTPGRTKNDKRPSSISNTAVDSPDTSISDKRKSSISNTDVDTPDRSKNNKRTSSISNSTAVTPDLSKNENNKSTLILSQLKDVSTTSENIKSPKSAIINEVLSKSDINEKSNNTKKVHKGNLSLNDAKGTPKQNNSVHKLSMQTSTPITTQPIGMKSKVVDLKHESARKSKSNFSKSINDTVSSEEDSNDDDQPSVEKNELLHDEAEEASDDYESGDSQDEEERRYENENEIVARGETLTSNDDISNDTDYEKDSFVVSSDAEDNELLSGSGDDLSVSDNELSMSKKSKKKYNDRNFKEQKKASREMFESRHKLNTSDKNSPTKTKKNRMRIDSSLLASDEEVVVKTKKTNRMRLDSTLDSSVKMEETNVSFNKSNKNKSMQGSMLDASITQEDTNTSPKKKNNKSMHDSIGNKSAIDEKEITVCNESTIDTGDPLQIKLKQEPKTPQKDLNISVVQVQQDIEGVQMTESNSILYQTGTDPLQATMAFEDSSDSSESEEIMQNYDSVLNELNKDNKTKLNNQNLSLNLGNKSKINNVEPIIYQLNLTQAKKTKKNKEQLKDESESKAVTEDNHDSDNENCSSSIDLHLLFSEDNCGSGDEQQSKQNKADDDNIFIPLKKSPRKINLRDSIEMNTSQKDTTLNESSKKKKNRKSSLGPAESIDEKDTLNISKSVDMSMNESGMEKKKKHSLSEPSVEEIQGTPDAAKPELNESTKKKRKSSLPGQPEDNLFFIDTTGTLQDNKENTIDESNAAITPKSEKKKTKHSCEESQENTSRSSKSEKKKNKHSTSEPSAEESLENTIANAAKTPKSEKKKKKHALSEPSAEESRGTPNASELELNESAKKKRKSSLPGPPEVNLFFIDTTGTLQDNKDEYSEISEPPQYERKKKKRNNKLVDTQSKTKQNEITMDESNATITPKSEKKKKKHSLSKPSCEESQENTIANAAKTPKSEKKKKKHALSEPSAEESRVHDEDSDGAPDEAPYRSEKASEVDLQNIENGGSAETGSAKKKHKKKKKSPATTTTTKSSESMDTENIQSNSNKRKRKSSNAECSQEDVQEVVESGKGNEFVGSKKKRKTSHNEDDNTLGSSESKQSKKNKQKNRDAIFQDTESAIGTAETQVKKNKKRKHRDEDCDSKKTKVSKDSYFQEVHVPCLPDSILRKLDDKPRKIEAPKVISTSNFIVENARQKRAKPSNYLEESVYLDVKSPLAKKEKPRIKKPKVLPFIPTASISESGFTTNFRTNKLSQFTTFEAEPVVFSKEDYLLNKKIKRLGTYDRYKKQMHHKMSKF